MGIERVRIDSGSATVHAGTALVAATQGKVTDASDAHLRHSPAPVAVAIGTFNPNTTGNAQVSLVIPNSITGLGAGEIAFVAIKSDGTLTRLRPVFGHDFADGGQSIVGVCNTAGDVTWMPSVYCHTSPTFKVNVKAPPFFAKGDGVHDDTQAILAAIGACTAVGKPPVGGTDFNVGVAGTGIAFTYELYFPRGEYLISDELPITGDLRLRGDHMTVIRQTNPTMAVLNVGCYYNVIEGLTLVGGRWLIRLFGFSTRLNSFSGSAQHGANGLTIQHCNLRQCKDMQIYQDTTGRFTTLSATALSGQNQIQLSNAPPFLSASVGFELRLTTATGAVVTETVKVQSVFGNTVTSTTSLANSYTAGDFVGLELQNRGTAAQIVIKNSQLEHYAFFWGGSDQLVMEDNYVVEQFNVVDFGIPSGAPSGQATIPVNSSRGVSPGDVLVIGGPHAGGPDGHNNERLTVLSTAANSITFASNLAFPHSAGEPVIHAPAVDEEYGFVLPQINSYGILDLSRWCQVPNTYMYEQEQASLQFYGIARVNDVRFGGETRSCGIRMTKTMKYNRHTEKLEPGTPQFFCSQTTFSQTARTNWLEIFDKLPCRMHFDQSVGAAAGVDIATDMEPLSGQIWIHDGVDLSVLQTKPLAFDFRQSGDQNVCLKFRQSSLANRRFIGAGTDVTHLFRQFAFRESPIVTQIGYQTTQRKKNLWFSNSLDQFDVSTLSGGIHLMLSGTDSGTGYTLNKLVCIQNAYLSPTGAVADPDDGSGYVMGLHQNDGNSGRWGAGLPAGEYTFSAYIKTNAVLACHFAMNFFKFLCPFMTVKSETYHRVWFPFYYDGVNKPNFSFVTENTIQSGQFIIMGLIMINAGTEPAPYVFPVDDAANPTTNLTDEDKIFGRYAASSKPASGTYKEGDFIRNTNRTELGTGGQKYIIQGWDCIAGGTLVERRTLTGN